MSYLNLLTDRCDIYHMKELPSTGAGGNWGVPDEDAQKEYGYSGVPDIIQAKCYFTEKSQSVIQAEPNTRVFREYLIHFLSNEDVRVNDKVIWNGEELKLHIPRKIKNHHIEVKAIRGDSL